MRFTNQALHTMQQIWLFAKARRHWCSMFPWRRKPPFGVLLSTTKKHDQQHAVPTSRTMACVYPFHLVHNLHAHAPSKMFTGHLFLSATKHSAKLIPSPGCLPVVRVLNRTNQAVRPLFIKIRCKLAKRCDGHVGRKERIP